MPVPAVRPDTLLIDLDGTLFDTLPDFVVALAEVAAEMSLPAPSRQAVQHAIGRGGQRLMHDLFGPRAEEAYALWPAHYGAVNGRHAQPYAGAHDTLAALRAGGWRLACVTNKPQALAEQLLGEWAPLFDAIVGAQPGLRAKPHPDALLKACALLQREPARCWMVGDSRNDAEAGEAAGCAGVVLFAHGYNHGEPIDTVPAGAHLARWPDLLPALRRLA